MALLVGRVGQYLHERGYLAPGDLPNLARAFAATADPRLDLEPWCSGWWPTSSVGPPASRSRLAGFLGDHEKAKASFLQFVCSSEIYKKQAAGLAA